MHIRICLLGKSLVVDRLLAFEWLFAGMSAPDLSESIEKCGFKNLANAFITTVDYLRKRRLPSSHALEMELSQSRVGDVKIAFPHWRWNGRSHQFPTILPQLRCSRVELRKLEIGT